MPRRCRGIRGDVGIAPYGRATGVWAYNGRRRVVTPPYESSIMGVAAGAGFSLFAAY